MHAVVLSIHFIAVVLGVGQVAAIALILGFPGIPTASLTKLMTFVVWSLLVVFLTGGMLISLVPDHPEKHLYLRLVMLLTLFMGYLSGTARKSMRTASDPIDSAVLANVRTKTLLLAGSVAAIVTLLASKPG